MSIKRDNLVNQFQDLCKQEVINHQRAIEATNLAIKDIQDSARHLRVEQNRKIEKHDENINYLSRLVEEFIYTFKEENALYKHKINGHAEKIANIRDDLNKYAEDIYDIASQVNELKTRVRGLELKQENNRQEFVKTKMEAQSEDERVLTRTRNMVNKIDERLSSNVDSLFVGQSRAEELYESQRGDVNRAVGSIRDIVKKVVYNEKKIESLYKITKPLQKENP